MSLDTCLNLNLLCMHRGQKDTADYIRFIFQNCWLTLKLFPPPIYGTLTEYCTLATFAYSKTDRKKNINYNIGRVLEIKKTKKNPPKCQKLFFSSLWFSTFGRLSTSALLSAFGTQKLTAISICKKHPSSRKFEKCFKVKWIPKLAVAIARSLVADVLSLDPLEMF